MSAQQKPEYRRCAAFLVTAATDKQPPFLRELYAAS